MKIYRFHWDLDRYAPWTRDDGVVNRIADQLPFGTPAAPSWEPPAGHIRDIAGHQRGDFPFWVDPVFSQRAREALAELCDPCGEWLPLQSPLPEVYFVFNVLSVVDCIDHTGSRFRRFPDGRVWAATRLAFHPGSLPPEIHCFRVPDMVSGDFYVTDTFVAAVGDAGLRGLAPVELWDSEAGALPIDLLTGRTPA